MPEVFGAGAAGAFVDIAILKPTEVVPAEHLLRVHAGLAIPMEALVTAEPCPRQSARSVTCPRAGRRMIQGL